MPLAAHLYNPAAQRRGVPLAARRDHPGQHQRPQLLERTARRSLREQNRRLNRKIKGLLDTTPNDYIRTKRLVVARADADRKPLPHQ